MAESDHIMHNTNVQYTHGLAGTNQMGNDFFITLLGVFFGVVGGIIIVVRLFHLGESWIRHVVCTGAGRDNQDYWTRNRTSWFPRIKQYILYAPLWNKRHNREWQLSKAYNVGTLPSRLHSTVLVLYFLSNLAYCAAVDYSQPRAAVLAELRGRTGALATFNLIPTILFALRNNPLIPLLRVSYDTFNLLHRSLARIAIAESLAHVLCWAINLVEIKGWSAVGHSLSSPFIAWGTVATAVFVLMGTAAWSPLRHAFYETFLNIHRLFALVSFIGVYEHLAIAHLPQLPYMILVFLFWALEWLARLARLWYHNFRLRLPPPTDDIPADANPTKSPPNKSHCTTVTVEALPREACRLTFTLKRHFDYTPGSHAHIYLPTLTRYTPWTSHPFSLAWADDIDTPTSISDLRPVRPDLGRAPTVRNVNTSRDAEVDVEKALGLPAATVRHTLDASRAVSSRVSCIVRAESGLTRELFNRAANTPNRILTLPGALEGPYGGHESLDSYGTCLLFCGGVGITHQLGFVRRLVEGHRDGTVAARKVVLVWSVTYVECLEWVRPFMDEILKVEGRREVLQVNIHVTRGTVDVSSRTGRVMMFKGRCDVQRSVDECFAEREGGMAVTCCGPGGFSDDVRAAVRRRVGLGALDFVEESFTY